MAVNECIPRYEPGQDLTGHAAAAITGRRFLRQQADKQGSEAVTDDTSGGNFPVAHAAPASLSGRMIGVSGYDQPTVGKKVKIVRGAGKVVPVESGAAIGFGVEVETDASGRAVPLGTSANLKALGVCRKAASASGQFPLIELYV